MPFLFFSYLKKMAFSAKKYWDIEKRKVVKQKEVFNSLTMSLFNNQVIEKQERQNNFNIFVTKFKKNASVTRIKNRCLLTNRSKAVIKFFRLSRLSFREKARNGELLGVVRASW